MINLNYDFFPAEFFDRPDYPGEGCGRPALRPNETSMLMFVLGHACSAGFFWFLL